MDDVDVRIVRALGVGPPSRHTGFAGLRAADVARRTGLGEQTVRDRLRALEGAGILEGYVLLLHPCAWVPPHEALGIALLEIDESKKPAAIARLQRVDHVIGMIDFLGPWAYVLFAWRGPAEKDARIAQLLAASGGRLAAFLHRTTPRDARPLTALEARIVTALAPDAMRPIAKLAEDVGVTAKTARARLDRLEREGLFAVRALFDRSRFSRLFAHVALVLDGPPPSPATLAAALGDRLLFAHEPPGPGDLDVGLFAASPADLEATRRALAALPGVARAIALVPAGTWDNAAFFRGLAARLAATADPA